MQRRRASVSSVDVRVFFRFFSFLLFLSFLSFLGSLSQVACKGSGGGGVLVNESDLPSASGVTPGALRVARVGEEVVYEVTLTPATTPAAASAKTQFAWVHPGATLKDGRTIPPVAGLTAVAEHAAPNIERLRVTSTLVTLPLRIDCTIDALDATRGDAIIASRPCELRQDLAFWGGETKVLKLVEPTVSSAVGEVRPVLAVPLAFEDSRVDRASDELRCTVTPASLARVAAPCEVTGLVAGSGTLTIAAGALSRQVPLIVVNAPLALPGPKNDRASGNDATLAELSLRLSPAQVASPNLVAADSRGWPIFSGSLLRRPVLARWTGTGFGYEELAPRWQEAEFPRALVVDEKDVAWIVLGALDESGRDVLVSARDLQQPATAARLVTFKVVDAAPLASRHEDRFLAHPQDVAVRARPGGGAFVAYRAAQSFVTDDGLTRICRLTLRFAEVDGAATAKVETVMTAERTASAQTNTPFPCPPADVQRPHAPRVQLLEGKGAGGRPDLLIHREEYLPSNGSADTRVVPDLKSQRLAWNGSTWIDVVETFAYAPAIDGDLDGLRSDYEPFFELDPEKKTTSPGQLVPDGELPEPRLSVAYGPGGQTQRLYGAAAAEVALSPVLRLGDLAAYPPGQSHFFFSDRGQVFGSTTGVGWTLLQEGRALFEVSRGTPHGWRVLPLGKGLPRTTGKEAETGRRLVEDIRTPLVRRPPVVVASGRRFVFGERTYRHALALPEVGPAVLASTGADQPWTIAERASSVATYPEPFSDLLGPAFALGDEMVSLVLQGVGMPPLGVRSSDGATWLRLPGATPFVGAGTPPLANARGATAFVDASGRGFVALGPTTVWTTDDVRTGTWTQLSLPVGPTLAATWPVLSEAFIPAAGGEVLYLRGGSLDNTKRAMSIRRLTTGGQVGAELIVEAPAAWEDLGRLNYFWCGAGAVTGGKYHSLFADYGNGTAAAGRAVHPVTVDLTTGAATFGAPVATVFEADLRGRDGIDPGTDKNLDGEASALPYVMAKLADGRLVLFGSADEGDGRNALFWATSADGQTWGAKVRPRPEGGWRQRLGGVAPLGGDRFLVIAGDNLAPWLSFTPQHFMSLDVTVR